MHRAHILIRLLSTTFLLASLAASTVMASESEQPMPIVFPLEELSLAKFSGGLTLRVKCGSQNELMIETSNEKAFSFKDLFFAIDNFLLADIIWCGNKSCSGLFLRTESSQLGMTLARFLSKPVVSCLAFTLSVTLKTCPGSPSGS